MRRSTRLDGKETISENKAKRKKSQSEDKITNIAAMDNGTMIESFKFLSYYQLAKNSLVSKRFWNLICTHRHKLALLDVNIFMDSYVANQNAVIKMFNDVLSLEEYNKFIARNAYSKQVPLEGQIANKENAENGHVIYAFRADAYQDSNHYRFAIATTVFYAHVKLEDENWPVFQYFIRLLMDPIIYIRTLSLNPQKYDFSFMAGAMNPDRNRLQCKQLNICFNDDHQKFIIWTKNHVRCDECEIYVDNNSNFDKELLDLFLTGAPCTSMFNITHHYDLSNVIVDFVQKFMRLRNEDGYQTVESICGYVKDRKIVNELTRDFAEFIAEQEQQDGSGTRQVVGLINNDIAKKLTLDINNFSPSFRSPFLIKITDL